jgi:hypothetical protein
MSENTPFQEPNPDEPTIEGLIKTTTMRTEQLFSDLRSSGALLPTSMSLKEAIRARRTGYREYKHEGPLGRIIFVEEPKTGRTGLTVTSGLTESVITTGNKPKDRLRLISRRGPFADSGRTQRTQLTMFPQETPPIVEVKNFTDKRPPNYKDEVSKIDLRAIVLHDPEATRQELWELQGRINVGPQGVVDAKTAQTHTQDYFLVVEAQLAEVLGDGWRGPAQN